MGSELAASTRRPLIGVTTSEVREAKKVATVEVKYGEFPQHEMVLGIEYLMAIEQAGGLPVVMPPIALDQVENLLSHLHGVCLSGGPDINPSNYGAEPHPSLGPTWSELDLFELAVARQAGAMGMPILAICRGAQTLNVARGGTLYQHLPEVVSGDLDHRQSEPGFTTTHSVHVDDDSRLARALGRTDLDVNSFHHQAIDQIGDGLRPVAWSPDDVIEGVEVPGQDFVVGVQWHAEGIAARPEQAALFVEFVEASRRFTPPGERDALRVA